MWRRLPLILLKTVSSTKPSLNHSTILQCVMIRDNCDEGPAMGASNFLIGQLEPELPARGATFKVHLQWRQIQATARDETIFFLSPMMSV